MKVVVYSRTGIYRSHHGLFLGVLKGIAERFDLSVFWLRVGAIITFLVTGFFPIALIYIVAALVMKKKPYFLY